MTLLDHIRQAMPVQTTELRMSAATEIHLRAERDALTGGHFDVTKLRASLADSGYTFAHKPVEIDDTVPPCTVVFVTNGKNYRFGWSL